MHQPVPYGMEILADFMVLQPIKEGSESGIMIWQVQFLRGQLISLFISDIEEAAVLPRFFPILLLR